jgi:hypothetical protein
MTMTTLTTKGAGVWIDHRKAHIVGLTADGEISTVILSKVEKHLERSGDSPMKGAYEALQVPADDSRQRALTGELSTLSHRTHRIPAHQFPWRLSLSLGAISGSPLAIDTDSTGRRWRVTQLRLIHRKPH